MSRTSTVPEATVAIGEGARDVLVAEELPNNGGLPDQEPYLQDVLIGRQKDGTPITERRFTLDTARAYLQACPKVQVFVRPDTLDELQDPNRGWLIPVTWKGITMRVPKCKPALVPLPIAEILSRRDEPLRTQQAKQRSIYVTEITDGGPGPEIVLA